MWNDVFQCENATESFFNSSQWGKNIFLFPLWKGIFSKEVSWHAQKTLPWTKTIPLTWVWQIVHSCKGSESTPIYSQRRKTLSLQPVWKVFHWLIWRRTYLFTMEESHFRAINANNISPRPQVSEHIKEFIQEKSLFIALNVRKHFAYAHFLCGTSPHISELGHLCANIATKVSSEKRAWKSTNSVIQGEIHSCVSIVKNIFQGRGYTSQKFTLSKNKQNHIHATYGQKNIGMFTMWEDLHQTQCSESTHEISFFRETIPMQSMWNILEEKGRTDTSRKQTPRTTTGAFRLGKTSWSFRTTIKMWNLRLFIWTAIFNVNFEALCSLHKVVFCIWAKWIVFVFLYFFTFVLSNFCIFVCCILYLGTFFLIS